MGLTNKQAFSNGRECLQNEITSFLIASGTTAFKPEKALEINEACIWTIYKAFWQLGIEVHEKDIEFNNWTLMFNHFFEYHNVKFRFSGSAYYGNYTITDVTEE